jgi:hypothetical protein
MSDQDKREAGLHIVTPEADDQPRPPRKLGVRFVDILPEAEWLVRTTAETAKKSRRDTKLYGGCDPDPIYFQDALRINR